jgi:Holliday junction DNA helicase RuvA
VIARLEGVLREKSPHQVVIDVAGVGYEVFVPLSTFTELPEVGKTIALRIHTHVREDAIQLYGFATSRERELFELLMRTTGVGPRLAQVVLSGMEPDRLLAAIAEGDVAALRRVPGLGQKKAERLVVELRERAAALAITVGSAVPSATPRRPGAAPQDAAAEAALSALTNLGYAKPEAQRVVELARADAGAEVGVEALLRAALRRLSR